MIAPWYGYQLATHREAFLSEHVAWLLLERGAGSAASAPGSQPLGYVNELAKSYWPWLPLAVFGLWSTVREALARGPKPAPDAVWSSRETAQLLITWLAAVLGIMSLAREKKLWYVMSVFPALALLSARDLARLVRGPQIRERIVLGGFAPAGGRGCSPGLTTWRRRPPA